MMHPQARHEANATFDSSAANSDSCVASSRLTNDYEEIVGSRSAKAGCHVSAPDASIPPSPNER